MSYGSNRSCIRYRLVVEIAYWNMRNDFPRADLLTLRLKSMTYPSTKAPGILCFDQAHDIAGTFAVPGGYHDEEYPIRQPMGKVYQRVPQCYAT